MKTINKIALITLFTILTGTFLFAQEQYEPFAQPYSFFENPSPIDFSDNWMQHSQQNYFPMRDESFSDFILRNNDWLMLASGATPASPGGSGRPGDFGAHGGIGHIPVGDGTVALILVVGFYMIMIFTRKKSRIEGFA